MNSLNIAHLRMVNQQLNGSAFTTAYQLVKWMGCIQSQEYISAKWAIANRVTGLTEADIDHQFNSGKILRTHVLRPTWHFICPEDIGWMLKLTAPRVKMLTKGLHRQHGLDDTMLKKSKRVLKDILTGGNELTRSQILPLLAKKKIDTDDQRLGLILLDAELEGLICSGAKQVKQFTYALLNEKVPGARSMDRKMAVKEMAKRYYLSHGPATIQDFAWWSGLTLTDCKWGTDFNKKELAHAVVNGQVYWFSAELELNDTLVKPIILLPAFDEYTIAYKDRSAVLDPDHGTLTGNGIFKPLIIENGKVAGTWRRSITKDTVLIEICGLKNLSKTSPDLIATEALHYAKFHGLKLELKDI